MGVQNNRNCFEHVNCQMCISFPTGNIKQADIFMRHSYKFLANRWVFKKKIIGFSKNTERKHREQNKE